MEQDMRQQPNLFDTALMIVFLIGLYTNFAIELGPKVPVPAIIAGAAGIVLLLRHADWVEQRHVIGLIGIITLYLVSVFFAPDLRMTDERLKGVFQLTYSLVLGYAFFLVARRYDRPRLAWVFLTLCVMLLVGTALENYTSFRNISDQARGVMFDFGNYDSDLRDEVYYGMVRPKLFTSEPSYLAFGFTVFAFGWYGISTWRLKLPVYLAGLAAGFLLMRSPTIFLGALLVLPYELFLASRRADGNGYNLTRGIAMTIASAIILIAAAWAASNTLAVRLREIQDGGDPSFFTRQIAPVLVAEDTFARHPLTGIGITSEEAVADRLLTIFIRSSAFSPDWNIGEDPARLITNYFWHHWIYFGLGWGLILVLGLHWMLRQMGVSSIAFCWIAWIVFGQSMGAYVSPRVWFVMFLAATIVSLHDIRVPLRRPAPAPVRPTPLRQATRVVGA